MAAPFLTIKCPNMPEVLAKLKRFGATGPDAVSRGLYSWGEGTRTVAVKRTPKDTGTLRNTIYVKRMEGAIAIGAGGPAAPYAKYVHESLRSKHGSPIKYKTPGTGPKYIENPIRERRDELAKDVLRELKKETERTFS